MTGPVVVIAANALRRLLRDRSNLFFVFVFPMLMVAVIGLQFGGSGQPLMGIVVDDDGDARALTGDLQATVDLRHFDTRARALDAVSRGEVDAAVIVPPQLSAALASGDATLEVALRPDAQALRMTVDAALARTALPHQAARSVNAVLGTEPTQALATARNHLDVVAGHLLVVRDVGTDALATEFAGLGQFDLGASSQLLLFVFLTSLAGGTAIIEARQFGVTRRILATPTAVGQIVGGEGLGRLLVALTQAAYLVIGTMLIYGVAWGDPLGAAAVILAFCAVGAGAGALLGAAANNLSQAGGLSVMAGLVLAALGGCMVPLEIFPETIRTIAHVTPHAWGNDAFAELVRRDGSLADVGGEVAVLLAQALVLWGLATWRLRHRLLVQ